MIQDLIEKYEKERQVQKELIELYESDKKNMLYSLGVSRGRIQVIDSILKDLRELEGKMECEHEMDFVYGPEGDYQGTVCFKCAHTGE